MGLLLLKTALVSLSVVISVGAVTIAPVKSPAIAPDTNIFVVLPCNFSTTDYPQITWYRHTDGKRNLVVRRNMEGRLTVSGVYKNRIGFGNRGDLILIKPEAEDSGHYSCEVEVDYENPTWAKIEMDLRVFHVEENDTRMTICAPCAETTNWKFSGKHGDRFIMFLDWSLPVVCTFVLARGLDRFGKNTWNKVRQSRILMAAIVVVLISHCLGLVMVFASILLFADSACTFYNRAQHAGLAIGVTGSFLLTVITALYGLQERISQWALLRKKKTGSSGHGKTDQEENVDYEFQESNETCRLRIEEAVGNKAANKRNTSNECFAPQPSSSPHDPVGKDKPDNKILQKPSEENVIGMVATSHKDIYLCSTSAVFYKNAEKKDENYSTLSTSVKRDFFMIAEGKTGVVVTVPTKRNTLFDDNPVLVFIEDNEKESKKKLDFHLVRPWVSINPDGESMYITDYEGGRVIRIARGKRIRDIGTGVLKNPVCVMQSRSGLLIVADSSKSDLFVFENNGNFITTVRISMPRNQENELKGCDKMAVDENGRIFVAGPYSRNVLVFSPDFRFDRSIVTGTEASGLISSLMVVKDSLYVAHEDCIRIYSIQNLAG